MMLDRVLCGDALEALKTLPDQSFHCCVTSPPYWGLRDYGIKGQIGLERTPEEYVARLVEVFREVRRVLRDDGTLWLNLGDSYASGKGKCYNPGGNTSSFNVHLKAANVHPLDRGNVSTLKAIGLKPKDLVGIPWRVAFALQADGWWLRKDIIWAKPNPMPESIRDRPTRSHEYIFLLSKSARYFYDQDAIKEPLIQPDEGRRTTPARFGGALKFESVKEQSRLHSGNAYLGTKDGKRNKRDVWWVATQPFPDAHYAVYPPELIRPCILAGTSARGCCPECSAPWERVVKKKDPKRRSVKSEYPGKQTLATQKYRHDSLGPEFKTIGWRPTCTCNGDPEQVAWDVKMGLLEYEPIPCTVLDPFFGAGTTGLVAKQEGRHYLGIELDPEWAEEKAQDRIHRECPMERLVVAR